MMNSGLILINKDSNISSQKVDNTIKHKLNLKKVGHLGTLDPLAKGLLVVGINQGTRFFKYFENLDKKYILRIRIGATSASLDNETEIVNLIDTDLRGKEEYIDNLLSNYDREYEQIPPIYSAIKVAGVPLYKYANSNKDVEIKSRKVKIYNLQRISEIIYDNGSSYFDILMHVSKGFYVRSFSKEFGDLLNLPSMADSINRIMVGEFNIKDSIRLDSLNDSKDVDKIMFDPLEYINFKRFELSDNEYKDVQVGKPLKIGFNSFDEYIVLTHNKENIAIYKYDDITKLYRMDLLIKNESILY